MTPAEALSGSAVLALARSLGVTVEPNGPRIRAVAPPRMSAVEWSAIVARLADHKAEVLAVLVADPAEPSADHLRDVTKMVEPAPYRRPAELSTWPIPLRERWGRRSEEFELAGVPWPDSEIRAFAEVKAGPDGHGVGPDDKVRRADPTPATAGAMMS